MLRNTISVAFLAVEARSGRPIKNITYFRYYNFLIGGYPCMQAITVFFLSVFLI